MKESNAKKIEKLELVQSYHTDACFDSVARSLLKIADNLQRRVQTLEGLDEKSN